MAAMLQGLGVASASVALSDYSVKISASSVHSLPVIRSEVRSSLGSINGSSRTGKAENPASVASKPGHELLLFEALGEGLEEEMDRDPRVCVMGEDVGHYGGSYKVTKGLAQKYGGHNSSCDPMTRRGRTPTQCRAFTEARGLFSVNPWNTDGCLFNPIQRQGSDEGCHPEGEPSGSF